MFEADEDRWLWGEPVEGIRFRFNDDVVATGEHAGVAGAVIAYRYLSGIDPVPVYLVERADGDGTIEVAETDLLGTSS